MFCRAPFLNTQPQYWLFMKQIVFNTTTMGMSRTILAQYEKVQHTALLQTRQRVIHTGIIVLYEKTNPI